MSNPNTHQATAAASKEFLTHAYQALFAGNIVGFEPHVRAALIEAVADDVATYARTLPPKDQEHLLTHFTNRMKGGH